MRLLNIDSLAGSASEGPRIALGRRVLGMNSRPWIWPSDQTTRHALANLMLAMLNIRLDGSLEVKSTQTTAWASAYSQTKHSFQIRVPGRIRLPILEAFNRVILLRSWSIARLLPELKLPIRTSSQSRDATCGFDDVAAFTGTVNGASA